MAMSREKEKYLSIFCREPKPATHLYRGLCTETHQNTVVGETRTPDMPVKLYEIEDDWRFLEEQRKQGILIRKRIGPEKQLLVDWVKEILRVRAEISSQMSGVEAPG